jgi:purine-binding chemotaxis protein CheW
MNKDNLFAVFILDEQRYALYLSVVERVVGVVEITPLPKAPDIVLGVVNVQGKIILVVDIRKRFHLPEREMNLSDHLIIAHTSRRAMALIADTVTGVLELSDDEIIGKDEILSDLEYVEGVVKLEDGMILIHDLEKFLSLEEEKAISDQLSGLGNQASGDKND